jgi:hypothetical protein
VEPGDRTASGDQRAIGELPPILGWSTVPTRSYDYDVSVMTTSIRVAAHAVPDLGIDAAGDWRYDTSTMDLMSFDEGPAPPA